MLSALLEYQFLQYAVLAAILASISCGIIGVVVIEKKLILLSGGIAHTAYGGVGLGYLLGFEPLLGAFGFAILAALGIGWLRRKGQARAETAISLVWALGMALGVLFIALMPGYPPALQSYLFGSILAVTRVDLLLMSGLTACILLASLAFYHHYKAYLFDEQFAAILGLPVRGLENFLLVMVAMAVVLLIRIVGIILLLALLAAPAAIAGLVRTGLAKRMLLAVLAALAITLSGLGLAYALDLPAGAIIAIFCTLAYFLTNLIRALAGQKVSRQQDN